MPMRVVACGVATSAHCAGGEAHLHRGIGASVRGGVRTRAANEGVCTRAAVEAIVVRSSVEGVVVRAAVEPVVALAAVEGVRARAAREHIGAGVANKRIVVVGALENLDADKGVALGVAPSAHAGGEAHLHRGIGASVRCGVLMRPIIVPIDKVSQEFTATAAFKGIGALAADEEVDVYPALQPVISRATLEHIGAGVADERIVVVGALENLDADEGVALGVAPSAHAGGEVHLHRGIGTSVRGGVLLRPIVESIDIVESAAAYKGIGALAADEGVRPCAAREHIVASVADERIAVVGALEVLDADEGVALGVATNAHAGGEVRLHCGIGTSVRGGVRPRAAVEAVVARATVEPVVAVTAVEGVVALATVESVVALTAGNVVMA